MYLLDTNVVSELPAAASGSAGGRLARAGARRRPGGLGGDAGEVPGGRGDHARAGRGEGGGDRSLGRQVAGTYAILSMDGPAFRLFRARLMHRQPDDLIEDAMIAAIARAHKRLTVVTRNVRDFARLGVPTLDPFVLAGS